MASDTVSVSRARQCPAPAPVRG